MAKTKSAEEVIDEESDYQSSSLQSDVSQELRPLPSNKKKHAAAETLRKDLQ